MGRLSLAVCGYLRPDEFHDSLLSPFSVSEPRFARTERPNIGAAHHSFIYPYIPTPFKTA